MPCNNDYEHALSIDKKHGNRKWAEVIQLEIDQQHDCNTCKGIGEGPAPKGCKKIRAHFVFNAKHDGRHKARLAAGGHLTSVPLSSARFGVISLRSVRLVLFLAELNGLEAWGTDIGNAYLEAFTKEKVCVVTGPEFGPLEGHSLIINKALCGLRTSGSCWHERLADCLRGMGFFSCLMEPNIWMRNKGDHYERITVCVGDLLIASKEPQSIISALCAKHKFKIKGSGPITYHLGCDFGRDNDDTLYFTPRKHIEKIDDCYFNMFGCKQKLNHVAPLKKGDHPKLDVSDCLDEDGVKKHQSLIGLI